MIDVLELARKYDVNYVYVKNFLRDQISQGLLKGELKKDVFYLDENFEIMDIKERRIKFMRENIGKFLTAYRSIKIKEIAGNFKVPNDLIISYMRKLMDQGILMGYFEGDSFIRDLSQKTKEIECPNCKEKINLKDL